MSTTNTMLVALATVIAAGCAGNGGSDSNTPTPDYRVVEVKNHNWLDATVYAVNDGRRHRMGTVGTHQSRRFTLPPESIRTGEVQLLVSLIGSSSTYITPAIPIPQGELIEFDVENHLPLSSYMVVARR